jgi:Transglycosylase-like domain
VASQEVLHLKMPSPKRHAVLAAAGLSAAALLPAADAGAVGPGTSVVNPGGSLDPVVAMAQRAHTRAVRRHVRLHRTNARLRGVRPDRDQRREVRDWSTTHLRRENRELRRENRKLRRAAAAAAAATAAPTATTATAPTSAGGASTASAGLEGIAACESGGDPSAVDATGTYRGKYQFDQQTWQSVGGSGDPAAAPEAEQDQRAAMLIAQRGSSPWPVCGG